MFKVAKALKLEITIVELLKLRQDEDCTEWFLYSCKYSTVNNKGNIIWQQSYTDYYQISNYSRILGSGQTQIDKVNLPVVSAFRLYSSHSSISASTKKAKLRRKRNTINKKLC